MSVSFETMIRALVIAFASGSAAGLFVVSIGRIVAYVFPGEGSWTYVAVVSGVAAVVGFGIAERAVSQSAQLIRRRAAGMLFLAGISMLLVLIALYVLPVFRSTTVASASDVVGPVIGLMFFPVMLISMGPRVAAASHAGGAVIVAGASILGIIAGWSLCYAPDALISPVWGVSAAALALHGAGLAALWPFRIEGRNRSLIGAIVASTAVISSILASLMNSALFFVIGSV